MSTNLHAKGAGIPLFFTSWTYVSSCNNASTFPSPSPANGQEGSSRELVTRSRTWPWALQTPKQISLNLLSWSDAFKVSWKVYVETLSSTHKKVFGQQKKGTKREQISEAPYGSVVGMADVASLSSRSMDQDPMLTPCGCSSYRRCQTRTAYLAELHWEVARKTWKTSQMKCGHGTLEHTEGMHTRLVQLVQSAKDLQKLQWCHCELCEIRLPEYQTASCVEDTFLVWRFDVSWRCKKNTSVKGLPTQHWAVALDVETSTVAWVPRPWPDYGGYQNKQNYHCILAGVELEKYAIDHEMSDQGNATIHKAGLHSEQYRTMVAIYNFAASLFCTAQSLPKTVWDYGRW